MAHDHKAKFRNRLDIITQQRVENLQKKRKELEAKERMALEEKEKLTTSIVVQGLWQSVSDVDNQLFLLQSETAKRKALQTQLKFRKIVLEQKHEDKEIFSFSKKRCWSVQLSQTQSKFSEIVMCFSIKL